MAGIAAGVFGVVAVLAWLSAALHAVLLLGHRRDDISLFALAWRGYLFFAPDTWKESGRGLHRRFLRSALVFFLAVVGGMVAGVFGAR